MGDINPYEAQSIEPREVAPPGETLPVAKMVDASKPLTTVATFRYAPQAHTAMVALKTEGFHAVIADEHMSTLSGILGQSVYGYIKLQVETEEADAAYAYLQSVPGLLLDGDHGAQTMSDDTCLSCGAQIPEDQETCPACGWSFDMGEMNESDEIPHDEEEEDERML